MKTKEELKVCTLIFDDCERRKCDKRCPRLVIIKDKHYIKKLKNAEEEIKWGQYQD